MLIKENHNIITYMIICNPCPIHTLIDVQSTQIGVIKLPKTG